MIFLSIANQKKEHLDHLMQIVMVLNKEKLFGNLKKFTLFTLEATFLGYIIMVQAIKVDESKIAAIRS